MLYDSLFQTWTFKYACQAVYCNIMQVYVVWLLLSSLEITTQLLLVELFHSNFNYLSFFQTIFFMPTPPMRPIRHANSKHPPRFAARTNAAATQRKRVKVVLSQSWTKKNTIAINLKYLRISWIQTFHMLFKGKQHKHHQDKSDD